MATTLDERAQVVVKEKKRPPLLVDVFIRLVKTKPLGMVGGVIVLLLLFVGIFADVLAPYGFNEVDMNARLQGPSAQHLLGADNMGRDLMSRVIYGARISMIVGLTVSVFATLIGMFIGIISGYLGGKTDIIIQRFVDAWMSFPSLLLVLTMMAVLGPGLGQIILVMSFILAIGRSRVIRSAVIGIKENVYVESARAIGVPTRGILIRHILPNIMAPTIIVLTTGLGIAILMEATLSFLGFGIPPPMPSWGGMLSGAGRRYMLLSPGIMFWPGLALAIVVWGINMLGDAVRDLLDPRLRGGLGRYGGITQEKLTKLTEKRRG